MCFLHLFPPTPNSAQKGSTPTQLIVQNIVFLTWAVWAVISLPACFLFSNVPAISLPACCALHEKHGRKTFLYNCQGNPAGTSTSPLSTSFINMIGPVKRQQLFKKNQEHKRKGSRRKTEQLMTKKIELKQDMEDNFLFKCYYCFQGNLGEYCIHK